MAFWNKMAVLLLTGCVGAPPVVTDDYGNLEGTDNDSCGFNQSPELGEVLSLQEVSPLGFSASERLAAVSWPSSMTWKPVDEVGLVVGEDGEELELSLTFVEGESARFHEETTDWACPAQLTVDGVFTLSVGDLVVGQSLPGSVGFREGGGPVLSVSGRVQPTAAFLQQLEQVPEVADPSVLSVYLSEYGAHSATFRLSSASTIFGSGVLELP